MSIFFFAKDAKVFVIFVKKSDEANFIQYGTQVVKITNYCSRGPPAPQEETNTTVWMFSLSLGTLAEIASPASLLRRGKAATG